MALAADVQVGDGILHVYSVHLESGRRSGECRRVQAEELAEDATGRPFGAVVGGDMNCPPGTDVMRAFTDGFVDAHADLPSEARATTRSGAAIDMILGRRVRFTAAGIGLPERWDRLSDHRPVWARLKLG